MLHESKSRLAESRSMMSSAIEQETVLPLAPRAGADLRAARERMGWSLQDIAACACASGCSYLEALEAGRISELPGNAYALGFLRTYAVALGLDPNEVARRFRAEAAAVNEKTGWLSPAGAGARRAGRGGGVARRGAGGRRLCRLVPACPARAGCPPRPARRCRHASHRWPNRPSDCSTAPAVAVAAPAEPPPVQQAEAPPVPAISPSSAAAAQSPVPPVPSGPVAHPAAGQRRRLGAGARPRRPGAAEPHPASRARPGRCRPGLTCC